MFNHSIFWLKLFQAKLNIKINKKHKEMIERNLINSLKLNFLF